MTDASFVFHNIYRETIFGGEIYIMDINDAKNLIRDTVRIYLAKNEYGEYLIPFMKQRPIYMVGAPGIGKSAIIEQVAKEFNIPVVSFSMTHLTRDNAIGMPVIRKVAFGDYFREVTELTVSEIIAAVYHIIYDSKKNEGILFLDEINCVSDTLAPLMLLFLQYKKFGNSELPPGWVIVTAGNPPEYNKSVQEFDLATMDRLKYIYIDPDVNVWMVYARKHGVHGAISAFLESHKSMFYSTKMTDNGPEYVTARGWEDLSKALQLYEHCHLPVSLVLIRQYVTDLTISESFYEYYNVYTRYLTKRHRDSILAGYNTIPGLNVDTIDYENRLALINQILDALSKEFLMRYKYGTLRTYLNSVVTALTQAYSESGRANILGCMELEIDKLQKFIKQEEAGNTLSADMKHICLDTIDAFTYWKENYSNVKRTDVKELIYMISSDAAKRLQPLKELEENIPNHLQNADFFIKKHWGEKELSFYQSGLNSLKYKDWQAEKPADTVILG